MAEANNFESVESFQQGEDELEQLNSPADYNWRCPCTGMPCHNVRFDRIQ